MFGFILFAVLVVVFIFFMVAKTKDDVEKAKEDAERKKEIEASYPPGIRHSAVLRQEYDLQKSARRSRQIQELVRQEIENEEQVNRV